MPHCAGTWVQTIAPWMTEFSGGVAKLSGISETHTDCNVAVLYSFLPCQPTDGILAPDWLNVI